MLLMAADNGIYNIGISLKFIVGINFSTGYKHWILHVTQRQRTEMSPKVKYRRWRVLKRQIQFDKVHGGRIYILLLQKCDHNDWLQRIALIPPFSIHVPAVWWMWSQTLTKRPVAGLWMVMV